ncbi:MAG: four helix bundle protein [Bacteroidota bacterium]
MESKKENILRTLTFSFAVEVIKLFKVLTDGRKEFVLSKQLLRSGTSIGANVREANNAESKADFIHKLAIAQKECDETMYWLELLKASSYLQDDEFNLLYTKAEAIIKIIKRSILTAKNGKS